MGGGGTSMNALITGGGGFLGFRIAQMLHERGDNVTVLGRRHYPHVERAGIRQVQADIRDTTLLRDEFESQEIVFHVAAIPGIWGKRRDFWAINVDGTQHVLDACRECGVAKLVFTSSPSVVFGEEPLCGVDESQPYPDHYLADYPETKAVAERMVVAANGASLATVSLRPHLIWGPGDPHLIPRIVDRARAGRLMQVGDGENLVDITYIDNAATAHLLAADALAPDAACAGQVYFISQGEPVNLWVWINDLLERLGTPRVTRRISHTGARRLGSVMEFFYRLFRRSGEPRMTRFLASQLAHSHYFDISAARRDLGYKPLVTTADGVDRLVARLE